MNAARRVAIVTGGATGIGRACVERFLADGMTVLFTDIDADAGSRTLRNLQPYRERVAFEQGNVRETAHNDAVARIAKERWGCIDVLVANAGLQKRGRLLDSADDDLETILDINLLGVARSCRAVLPAMIEQGKGAIVALSSINAITGFPRMAAYDAAKAAVISLMRHIAVEHGSAGIRANAVCPGATLTDFHVREAAERGLTADDIRRSTRGYGLVGRVAEPFEIANVVAFLAGEQAAFITGQAIVADGGYTVAAQFPRKEASHD
jgi:meso-butanediol dehydrogenase/(S,S)-butanediol dehydrogenase/diacetyl reductase